MSKLEDYKKADLWIYQKFVGKLIYLLYGIRLDIAFLGRQFSKPNADPKIGYHQAVKRVIW